MDISLCRQLLLTVARRLLLRSLASRFLKCILLLLTRLRRALLGRKPSARKGASKRRPSQTPFDQQLTVDDLGTCEAVCPCNEPTSRETCENEFRAVFSHDGSTDATRSPPFKEANHLQEYALEVIERSERHSLEGALKLLGPRAQSVAQDLGQDSPSHTRDPHTGSLEATSDSPIQIETRSTPRTPLVIKPISTASVRRYARNVIIPQDRSQCMVQPLTVNYTLNDEQPEWTTFVHPEGSRYFFHREKKIFTDAWLHIPGNMAVVNDCSETLFSKLNDHIREGLLSPGPDIELVLELMECPDGDTKCGYYFVDNTARCLFWVEEFDASFMCHYVPVVSLSHLGKDIKLRRNTGMSCPQSAQVWINIEFAVRKHWELFPNTRMLSQRLLDEVREIIVHASADTLTSPLSIAYYDAEQLSTLRSLVNDIRLSNDEGYRGYTAWVVGRLMHDLTNNQFLNFHGQICARLNIDQSVYGRNHHPRSVLFRFLSPLLFSTPDVYLQALDSVWVDGYASINLWKQVMGKLNTEWQEFIIVDTVILNANVAFLAIHSVDNTTDRRSAAQIASYISVVASLGSVMMALTLLRQYRTKNIRDANQVISHFSTGTDKLAIIYSLPYVLLVCSILTFLVAFSCMCFTFSNTITRSTVGSLLCTVGVLILYSAAINGGPREGTDPPQSEMDDECDATSSMEPPNGYFGRPWSFSRWLSMRNVGPDPSVDKGNHPRRGWMPWPRFSARHASVTSDLQMTSNGLGYC